MRNSPFLVWVWLPLIWNSPLLIWGGLPPMRNSPFLIWVWLPLIWNSPLLFWSALSRMRKTPLLIRVCLPRMRKSRFLIRVWLLLIKESRLSGGTPETPARRFGRPSRIFTAKKVTRSATFYKHLSRIVYLSPSSRGWTSPVVVTAMLFLPFVESRVVRLFTLNGFAPTCNVPLAC